MADDDGRDDEVDADEERWCAEQREVVVRYLRAQGMTDPLVGEWPAWHVDPYVGIWAVESVVRPGWVGWWAIAGDLPTDYVTVGEVRHPRQGMRDIAARWKEVAAYMRRGELHPTCRMGTPQTWSTLAPLLESRVLTLENFASQDAIWPE